MARWAANCPVWTPVGVSDLTAFTDGGHQTLQGGSTLQRGEIREIYMGGLATTGHETAMVFGRTGTTGTTRTATRLAALDPSTETHPSAPTSYQTSGTVKPSRHSTFGMLLNLSFNTFGGIVRWYAGPDQVISYLGNAAPFGELSLNSWNTGSPGALGSNIVFEVL